MLANTELKKILGWVAGLLIALICWFGTSIVERLDNVDRTTTTILVNQQGFESRVTALEAANAENKLRWKEHDEFKQSFFETYELKKRKQ